MIQVFTRRGAGAPRLGASCRGRCPRQLARGRQRAGAGRATPAARWRSRACADRRRISAQDAGREPGRQPRRRRLPQQQRSRPRLTHELERRATRSASVCAIATAGSTTTAPSPPAPTTRRRSRTKLQTARPDAATTASRADWTSRAARSSRQRDDAAHRRDRRLRLQRPLPHLGQRPALEPHAGARRQLAPGWQLHRRASSAQRQTIDADDGFGGIYDQGPRRLSCRRRPGGRRAPVGAAQPAGQPALRRRRRHRRRDHRLPRLRLAAVAAVEAASPASPTPSTRRRSATCTRRTSAIPALQARARALGRARPAVDAVGGALAARDAVRQPRAATSSSTSISDPVNFIGAFENMRRTRNRGPGDLVPRQLGATEPGGEPDAAGPARRRQRRAAAPALARRWPRPRSTQRFGAGGVGARGAMSARAPTSATCGSTAYNVVDLTAQWRLGAALKACRALRAASRTWATRPTRRPRATPQPRAAASLPACAGSGGW